jgi:hypothetical protein
MPENLWIARTGIFAVCPAYHLAVQKGYGLQGRSALPEKKQCIIHL